jgi:glycerol dehydrogenase-like iron-containing ADH family enzyme
MRVFHFFKDLLEMYLFSTSSCHGELVGIGYVVRLQYHDWSLCSAPGNCSVISHGAFFKQIYLQVDVNTSTNVIPVNLLPQISNHVCCSQ